MKKSNQRLCIVTGKKLDKADLIRIVKFKNDFKIDNNKKTPGRGVYIMNNINIIDMLLKQKFLHKAFKESVKQEVYDKIIKKIKEGINDR